MPSRAGRYTSRCGVPDGLAGRQGDGQALRPEIQFGMIAGAFQYRPGNARRGRSFILARASPGFSGSTPTGSVSGPRPRRPAGRQQVRPHRDLPEFVGGCAALRAVVLGSSPVQPRPRQDADGTPIPGNIPLRPCRPRGATDALATSALRASTPGTPGTAAKAGRRRTSGRRVATDQHQVRLGGHHGWTDPERAATALDYLFPTTGGTDSHAYSANGTSRPPALPGPRSGDRVVSGDGSDLKRPLNAAVVTSAAASGASPVTATPASAPRPAAQRTDWQALSVPDAGDRRQSLVRRRRLRHHPRLTAVPVVAISRVGSASAAATSVTCLPPGRRDVILIYAYGHQNNTARPDCRRGGRYRQQAGRSSSSFGGGWRRATRSGTTSGTWTNATRHAIIYRRPRVGDPGPAR